MFLLTLKAEIIWTRWQSDAYLWIISDDDRAPTKYLFSYVSLMLALQITSPFQLQVTDSLLSSKYSV